MQNDVLKLLVVLGYSFFVAFSSLEYFYGLPLLIVLWLHKKQCHKIIKKVLVLNFFILFLVLFVAFQNQTMAIELLLRTNLILLFTITLFFNSKGYDIIRGLDGLRVSPIFITVFYFTLTMIQFLRLEILQMKSTLKARNFQANTSLFAYQTFGNVFAMMLIKALKKSQELHYTMRSRGFNGKIPLITSHRVSWKDILICGMVVLMMMIKGWMLL